MNELTAFVFAFLGEQLKQDIPFLLIVVLLSRFNLVTVTMPAWMESWLEPEDLAPVATFYSEESQ